MSATCRAPTPPVAGRRRAASTWRLRGRGLPRAARRDSTVLVLRFYAYLADRTSRRLSRLSLRAWQYVHLRRPGHAERARP